MDAIAEQFVLVIVFDLLEIDMWVLSSEPGKKGCVAVVAYASRWLVVVVGVVAFWFCRHVVLTQSSASNIVLTHRLVRHT